MKSIEYQECKKCHPLWMRWTAIFLLLCLFQADAQAYVSYARYAIQKNRIESELQNRQVCHECHECREPPFSGRFSPDVSSGLACSCGMSSWDSFEKSLMARFSTVAGGSHSHIPVSMEVNTAKEVGEIPYQSGTTPTGGVTYTVPVEVAPGRGGMQPRLSITYNSQGGNGALGYGWGIGGLSVISKVPKNLYYNGTTAPVSLTAGDALTLDGMRLLPTGVTNQFEPERGNTRVTGHVYNGDYRSFTVEYPNGMTGTYGFPSGTTKQLSFPITRLTDALGNYMDFTYEQVENVYHVTKISYGAHLSSPAHLAEVLFTYENRPDAFSVYEAGREIGFSRLLSKIECKSGSETLHTYTLMYERNSWNDPSLLTTIGCDNLNPLCFYYGYADNTDSGLQYDGHVLYPYFGGDVSIVASKFKIQRGEEDDGLIVYPDKSPFVQYGTDRYESGFAANQRLMVYGHVTDFSTPLPMEFTAGVGFQCLMAGDVDGKSGDELLKINNTVVNGRDRLTVAVYKYNVVSLFGLANTFTFDSTPAKSNSIWPKRYLLGDFNGDGTVELMAVSINAPLSQWSLGSRVFLFNPDTNTTYYNAASPFSLDASEQLIPMDVDGDGKTEICHFGYNGLSVYSFQVSSAGVYSFTKLFTDFTLTASYLFDRIYAFGDINGDGKCDMVVSPKRSHEEFTTETMPVYTQTECTNCSLAYVAGTCPLCGTDVEPAIVCVECETLLDRNGNCPYHGREVTKSVTRYYDYGNYWDVYYNTGTGFHKTSQYNSKYDTNGIRCLLQDVNRDGCADLVRVHGKNLSVYYSQDGRLSSSPVSLNIPSMSDDVTLVPSNVALPDYYNFLLAIHGETLLKFYSAKDETKQRFLTGMTTSLGVTWHNYYQRLNDDSIEEGMGAYYDDGYVSPSFLPYESYYGPLWAVSRQDVYDGKKRLSSVAYNYKGGVLHRQGLGFRGFTEIHTQDLTRDKISKAIYDPLQYGIPVSVETDKAKETYTYKVSVASNKKLTANPWITDRVDKLTGVRSRTLCTYDQYGYPTQCTDYVYDKDTLLVDQRRKEVFKYLNQTEEGRYMVGRPEIHYSHLYVDGILTEKRDSVFYMSDTPLPLTRKTFVNGMKTGETRYTYDAYGNVLTETCATYNSTNFVGDSYTYGADGRYLSTVTDALGRTTTYHAYNKWGKPTSVTNHLGKQTTYAYDASGRITTTVVADGTIQSVSYLWNPGKGLFGVLKSATGLPDELVCYDALKREVRTGQQRFDGTWLYVDKEYDEYGRLGRESMPFKGSVATKWTSYMYDSYDRLIKISEASGKQTTYSHSGNSVTTTERGISTVRTNDLFGRLSKVATENGEIRYVYGTGGLLRQLISRSLVKNPDYGIGEAEELILGADVVTSFEYDAYGRRTKIIDPSAGTQTYTETNRADGSRTATQTDAKGLTTKVHYDVYGRVVSVERPEFNTSYTYDAVTKKLQSEVSTNGTKKEYTYDAYGRLNTEKETVDNVWLQKTYTYAEGNVSKVAYSSSKEGGIGEECLIYANGTLQEVKLDATSVWKLTAENELGQPSEVLTGPMTRAYGYTEFGFPALRKVGNLQHFTYQFDVNTGNLLSRTDAIRNRRETFDYDRENRLEVDATRYIEYAGNGNRELVSEFNAETCVYIDDSLYYREWGSPYRLTEITNESDPHRRHTFEYNASGECVRHASPGRGRDLRLTYTSQMRPEMLTEEGNTVMFLYDANGDRKRMTVSQNGTLMQTKYYLGDQYETDGEKTLLYLNGNAYSSPIVYVKEGSEWKIYYICRDYLGSITHLANADGTLAQELSYDAWGRLRNPQTQEVYGASEQPVLKLGRGYTGHEHLSLFGLVNMNARLYDPVLGRFLSPDPYVQMPDNLQNLNRYSYCLNNPLAYVDEDGEFLHIIIGAAIGGLLNWASHGFKINAKGLGYFFTGAAAGAAGGLTAGIFSAAIGGGVGFTSGALVGAGSGFSCGFIGGVGNSLVEGQGLWTGMKSGIAGAGIGFLTGGITGGITEGLSALKHGGNFWTGKGATFVDEFAASDEEILGGDYFKTDEELHKFVHEGNGWEPGMYGIKDISMKTVPGDYGNKLYSRDMEGVILRFEDGGGIASEVAGVTERVQTGLFTTKVRIHMSPHYSLAEFKATLNHELIHAYHRTSDMPFLLGRDYHNATEQSAFTYSLRYAPSERFLQNAREGLMRYKSPYRFGWPEYLIK